jgi:hypothetical protein
MLFQTVLVPGEYLWECTKLRGHIAVPRARLEASSSGSDLLRTAHGLYPVTVSLCQCDTQVHKSHAQYTYHIHTNIYRTK